MKKRLFLLMSGFLLIGLTFGMSYMQKVSATVPGTNTFVSVNSSGGYGGNNIVVSSAMSADGSSVVFRTSASNIVTGDTNGTYDVFVRNLKTNTTTRVDVSSSGIEANGAAAAEPGISRTGRFVAFESNATNLIDGQSTRLGEVYVHDMVSGTTSLVTKTSSGAAGLCGEDHNLAVSSDGRFVMFTGQCTNLGPTLPSGDYIYEADRQLGTFTVVSAPLSGGGSIYSNGTSSMSCDGTIIAFATTNQDTSDDLDTQGDVYIADLRNGLKVTNITSQTTSSTTQAYTPYVSCSGDYVTFASTDSVFAPTQVSSSDANSHIYLYDRVNGTYTLVDQSSSGAVANAASGGGLASGAVDDKGNVAFSSSATNLGTSVINYPYPDPGQLWLRNTSTGTTELLSKTSSGAAADWNGGGGGGSTFYYDSISADGRVASYVTNASNLIGTDLQQYGDALTSLTGL